MKDNSFLFLITFTLIGVFYYDIPIEKSFSLTLFFVIIGVFLNKYTILKDKHKVSELRNIPFLLVFIVAIIINLIIVGIILIPALWIKGWLGPLISFSILLALWKYS